MEGRCIVSLRIQNVDVQVTVRSREGELELHAVDDAGRAMRLRFEPMVGMTLADRIIMAAERAGMGA
jgi:hypothetical protein